MTVTNTTARNQYTATAGQTVFAYTFEVYNKNDLVVLQNDTTLAEGTNYTVSGVGSDSGGNITLTVGATAGDIITVYRDMALERLTDYQNSGDFLAAEVNEDFDRLWLAVQQGAVDSDRAIVKPVTDLDSISTTLPSASDRANSFLTFNGSGAVTVTSAGDPSAPSTIYRQQFTGDGSTTAFSLTVAPGGVGQSVQVFIDGVYQEISTFSISGSTLNFSEAPPLNSSVEYVAFKVGEIGSADASVVTYIPAGTGAVSTTVQAKLRESVSVKDFGAVGDGVTDDTAAIQAAIDYAEANTKVIYFPSGTFSVSTLSITNGIRGISCDGIIKGQGSAAAATIVIGETGAGVSNAVFNLRMDQSAGDLVAVKAYDIVGCTFDQCQIYGFVNSATTNHYAFWCIGPCLRNMFTNNHITLYDTPTQRGFGIALYGPEGASEYGGFFTGALVQSATPANENIIANNTIINGSYAVSLQYAEECIVDGNYCRNQNHRGMYIAVAALRNVISNNQIVDFLSSAVLLGYNAWHNVVSGNSCYSSGVYASGEAAININTGSSYNLISGNTIESPTNYGIYMGADMRSNVVQGNYISNHYLSAIGLDNDFIAVRPANSSYSRPNYGAPPAPYTAWSYVNSSDNVIKNNTIGIGYTGRNTAAIEVSQINGPNTTQVTRTIITGNDVISADNILYNLWFYADTDGRFFGTNVTNNNFNSGNSEASYNASGATTWAARITYYADNEQFDEVINGEPISFADGDATPSVVTNSSVPSERLYQFANTVASTLR